MRRKALLIVLVAASAAAGCGAPGRRLIYAGGQAVSAQALVDQAPLPADQNIRATPLERGEHASLALVQIRDREQPHLHTRYDLTVVLLRGAGTLWLDARPVPMGEGDTAFIPKNTPHFFVNDGRTPATALVTFAPPFDGPDQQAVADPGS